MSTKTHDQQPAEPKHAHRNEHQSLEMLEHMGLVRDLEDKLTPIDILFNPKESSDKPKREPRHIL